MPVLRGAAGLPARSASGQAPGSARPPAPPRPAADTRAFGSVLARAAGFRSHLRVRLGGPMNVADPTDGAGSTYVGGPDDPFGHARPTDAVGSAGPADPTVLYRVRDSAYAADLLIAAVAELDVFSW